MRIQALYDLQQDINRLFIAGSKFAKGDPRLQKQIAVLVKLGEKTPVLKKLASDIEELLQTERVHSAEKLMSISTLLYSVLYTQGELLEADVEETEQLPHIELSQVNTEYSYLQLKPLIEALSTSNSGRLEVLKEAQERNIMADSRTYPYLNSALGDKYSELADYVEKTLIPAIGKPMIPFLQRSFTYEDCTENARKLRLMHRLEVPGIEVMIARILEESLPLLQAECVPILCENPENEELIIKLADDKNKPVREAAYRALAQINTHSSLEKLKEVYLTNKNKTNLPAIVSALAASKLPFFFQEVFDQVVSAYKGFVELENTADDKVLSEKLERFRMVLEIFENKENDAVFEFLGSLMQDKKYHVLITEKKTLLERMASAITHSMISIFNTWPNEKMIAFYEQFPIVDKPWTQSFWGTYFYRAAEAGYTKEKMYDTFYPVYKKKFIDNSNLFQAFSNSRDSYAIYYNREVVFYPEKMDSRWIEVLYEFLGSKGKWSNEHDHALYLIHAFTPKSDKRFNQRLVELSAKVQASDGIHILKLMMEREQPDRFEHIYSVMEKIPKNTYYYALNRLKHIGFWQQFPKEYAEKFRKLYAEKEIELFSDIADEINLTAS